MGPFARVAILILCGAVSQARLNAAGPGKAADEPLAKARQLYNQGNFEGAIAAAEQVRAIPDRADAADLVVARAYLERFRLSQEDEDLANARVRLRRLDPVRFDPRERVEYAVGLGEALYFDGAYGAAADVFDTVLRGPDTIATINRERILDWWADALDRDTRPRPDIDRQEVYRRIRARMDDELARRPANAAAAYWRAAAARSQGDLQSAWDAAQAAWVCARLTADGGAQLRADVDRLVTQAIVPDRAKLLGQPPERLQTDWDQFKMQWTK